MKIKIKKRNRWKIFAFLKLCVSTLSLYYQFEFIKKKNVLKKHIFFSIILK